MPTSPWRGDFLQLVYGEELLIGSDEFSRTRIKLCVYNHMLTVDFPPITQCIFYDLSQSISAMCWPSLQPQGKKIFNMTPPYVIGDVLLEICQGIQPVFGICDTFATTPRRPDRRFTQPNLPVLHKVVVHSIFLERYRAF